MRSVSEIMTRQPEVCTADTKLEKVARLMVDCDCGEIPIVNSQEEKKPVGVITDRDIAIRTVAEGKNPLDLTAQDCMTSSVHTIREDASLEECLNLMEEKKIRRVPVVDSEGKCCGIISQGDIARELDQSETGDVVRNISEPSSSSSQIQ